jgi:hypothetical protein
MLNYEFPIDDTEQQKKYDYSFIKKAFDEISNSSQIEFNFPQGGCQQRSHVMSMILSKKFNIEHSKIWLFSPAALYHNDTTTLFIEDKNKISPENIIRWNYHTAPIVKVTNKSGMEQRFVIDPSLNRKEPLLLENWLKNIGNSQYCKYTFLLPEKYFFNCKYDDNSQLTNIFDGSFFEFVNPAKDNLVLEKGLAVADMAIIIYEKYIKPLMNSMLPGNETTLFDLKEIFGNATALDLLFSQNISGNTDNTSYRYVLTHYEAIMKEAKQLFHERLLHWTKFTNELI